MIHEIALVVLTHDIIDHGLQKGDIGTVVHGYADNAAYEVEFVTAQGRTVAVLTLTDMDIRPLADREILHVRALEPMPA
jgi:hypothetical protein